MKIRSLSATPVLLALALPLSAQSIEDRTDPLSLLNEATTEFASIPEAHHWRCSEDLIREWVRWADISRATDIADDLCRDYRASRIIAMEQFSAGDVERALKTLAKSPPLPGMMHRYDIVLGPLARTNPDRAIEFASSIENPKDRVHALFAVGRVLIRADDARGQELLKRALSIAVEIGDALSVRSLRENLLASGDYGMLEELLPDTLTDLGVRASLMARVSELAPAKQDSFARLAIEAAWRIRHRQPLRGVNSFRRRGEDPLVSRLAARLRNLRPRDALRYAASEHDSVRALGRIAAETLRDTTSGELATRQWIDQAGEFGPEARVDATLTLLRSIRSTDVSDTRRQFLSQLLEEAALAAENIPDQGMRDRWLFEISSRYVHYDIAGAERAARIIEADTLRSEAYVEVARGPYRIDPDQGLVRILDRAVASRLLPELVTQPHRDEVIAAMSLQALRDGDADVAQQSARSIALSDARFQVLLVIARELGSARDEISRATRLVAEVLEAVDERTDDDVYTCAVELLSRFGARDVALDLVRSQTDSYMRGQGLLAIVKMLGAESSADLSRDWCDHFNLEALDHHWPRHALVVDV